MPKTVICRLPDSPRNLAAENWPFIFSYDGYRVAQVADGERWRNAVSILATKVNKAYSASRIPAASQFVDFSFHFS